jgi:hypothetical protein
VDFIITEMAFLANIPQLERDEYNPLFVDKNELSRGGVYNIMIRYGRESCVYYGQTYNFRSRFMLHVFDLRSGYHHNAGLQKAFNSAKDEDVWFQILDIECSKKARERMEMKYIRQYPNCLNIIR